MTTLKPRPLARTSRNAFRYALTGAQQSATGRPLVIELYEAFDGETSKPMIGLREKGRRERVEISLTDLYCRALIGGRV